MRAVNLIPADRASRRRRYRRALGRPRLCGRGRAARRRRARRRLRVRRQGRREQDGPAQPGHARGRPRAGPGELAPELHPGAPAGRREGPVGRRDRRVTLQLAGSDGADRARAPQRRHVQQSHGGRQQRLERGAPRGPVDTTTTAGGPTFALAGCASSQSEIATILTRLQAVPSVTNVSLADSAKQSDNAPNTRNGTVSRGSAASQDGRCPFVSWTMNLNYSGNYTVPNTKLSKSSSSSSTVSASTSSTNSGGVVAGSQVSQ